MDDTEALNNLVEIYQNYHYKQSVALLNLVEEPIYMSEALVNLLFVHRLFDHDSLPKASIYELLKQTGVAVEYIAKIKATFSKLTQQKYPARWLSINPLRQHTVLSYIAVPVYNSYSKQVIGSKVLVRPLNISLRLFRLESIFKPKDSIPEKSAPADKLSIHQQEVLYLSYQCKNYQEIAKILSNIYQHNFSENMIKKINQQLYEVFKVYNHPTLLTVAAEDGYHKKIPPSLISRISFLQDDEL